MIEIINKPLLLYLVGYLYYWQMGFNSVFKGLSHVDKRRRKQRWQSAERDVGPVFVGQAETNTLYNLCNRPNHETKKPWDEYQKNSRNYEIPPSATRLTRSRRHARSHTKSHTRNKKFSDVI